MIEKLISLGFLNFLNPKSLSVVLSASVDP